MTIVSRSRIVQRIGSDVEFLYGVDDKQRTVAVPYGAQPINVTQYPYSAKGDGITDDTTAIQAAIDAAYAAGGGEVYLPIGKFVVSSTITIPQRVTLVGSGAGFVNQYVDNYAAPKGTILFVASGSDSDAVQIICRLTNNSGTLEETTLGGRNVDVRHFGGMRNITVWGNRSDSAAPTEKDLNASGHGVRISGSRYVTLHNVVSMFCAEDGVKIESHNYGTGTISCNNLRLDWVSALSNGGNGFTITAGDSALSNINAGYNAALGVSFGMSGTLTGGLIWNNGTSGLYTAGIPDSARGVITGMYIYDNDENGIHIGADNSPHVVGCMARGNGRDTGAAATSRCNYLVASSARGWNFVGCVSDATDQTGTEVTQYGFRIVNSAYSGTLEGCTDSGSVTPYYINDPTKLIVHGSITEKIDHPSIRMLGALDANDQSLMNAGFLTFGTEASVTSITANTLTVTKSTIGLNCTGAQTITDISFSGTGRPLVIVRNLSADAVTFTHNASKIRCANATDAVLAQYEAIMLVQVTTGVWQQIGAAA